MATEYFIYAGRADVVQPSGLRLFVHQGFDQ